jgi:lipopolysaccharide transport system permease protein
MKPNVTIIEPQGTWVALNLRELVQYKDLFYFLVWRNIKAQYAQSVLGVGWAVIQPVISMLVFTVVFGKLAKVPSDDAPYAIFSFVALVPWTYFSNSLTGSASSLVAGANMLTKIYFPRLVLPFTASLGSLVGFFISSIILVILMMVYQVTPTIWVLFLPVLLIQLMLASTGFGLWLSAMAIQYRDVKHALSFGVQLFMYLTPVVYPASLVPEQYRLIYALNPVVGVIEGFRSALLGTNPMPWDLIFMGSVTTVLIFISGIFYFKKTERIFADVA